MGGSGDVVGSWVPSQLVHHLLGKPSQPLGSPPICTRPQTPPAAGLCTAMVYSAGSRQFSAGVVSVFVCGPKARCHSVGEPQSVTISHILPLSFSQRSLPQTCLACLGKSGAAMCTFSQVGVKPQCVSPSRNLKHSSVFTAML